MSYITLLKKEKEKENKQTTQTQNVARQSLKIKKNHWIEVVEQIMVSGSKYPLFAQFY